MVPSVVVFRQLLPSPRLGLLIQSLLMSSTVGLVVLVKIIFLKIFFHLIYLLQNLVNYK